MPRQINVKRRRAEHGKHAVVLVTCGSRREAARLARAVVQGRLAACVNIVETPVRSIYRWKDKVEQAREFLLVIKTARARLRRLRAEVERMHSYDVPEFLVLPVLTGSPAYLLWLDDCVRTR